MFELSGAKQAPASKLLRWEKAETTETVLTDKLTCARVVNIDEHVFIGMAGEETRKYFDEVFLRYIIGIYECFTDIEPVRPLAAIEPGPKPSPVNSSLIQ